MLGPTLVCGPKGEEESESEARGGGWRRDVMEDGETEDPPTARIRRKLTRKRGRGEEQRGEVPEAGRA